MHKNSANYQIIGKKIDFLPECHSTNTYVSQNMYTSGLPEGYVAVADYQTGGKGQRGNAWESEPGKNLLFSVLLHPGFLQATTIFLLNILSSVSLKMTLQKYLQPYHLEAEIKWPNDLYVQGKKIAGILVETSFQAQSIAHAIVGIGINVNQETFATPAATSLINLIGQPPDSSGLLTDILMNLDLYYQSLKEGNRSFLLQEYHKTLMWKGEIHTFRQGEELFEGVILGVNSLGKLMMDCNGTIYSFGIKEIAFVS